MRGRTLFHPRKAGCATIDCNPKPTLDTAEERSLSDSHLTTGDAELTEMKEFNAHALSRRILPIQTTEWNVGERRTAVEINEKADGRCAVSVSD